MNMFPAANRSKRVVVAFTADQWEHVCPTIRILAPLRYAGLEVIRGNEWVDGEIRFHLDRLREADAVLVQRDFARYREVFAEIVARTREQRKPLVFDIDDLLVELPASHPDYEYYRRSRAAILWAASEADVITVSTPVLQRYFRQFNRRVEVLPNCLIDDLWQDILSRPLHPPTHQSPSTLVVGFMGGHGHIADLEWIEPVIERVLNEYPHVRFLSWGCPLPERLQHHPSAEWVAPGLVDYAEFVCYFAQQESHIFLAPLAPSFFNSCKSALKYLEYSALGVPGIYSAVGDFSELVHHRTTGLLASTPDEWLEFLVDLIERPEERHRLGQNARQSVQAEWLLSRHTHKWSTLYNEILTTLSPKSTFVFAAPTLVAWYEEMENEVTRYRQTVDQLERQSQTVIEELKKQYQNLYIQYQQLQSRNQELHEHLHFITNSPGWKLLGMIWPLRTLLIPPHSRREKLFSLAVQAIWRLKTEGIRSLIQKPRKQIQSGQSSSSEPFLAPLIEASTPTPVPLLSLIVDEKNFDVRGKRWLAEQTWSDIEVICWNRNQNRAAIVDETSISSFSWDAPDVHTLLQGAHGKYVCFATDDLFNQRATYIEENLIALETEELAFTVNGYFSHDSLKVSLNTRHFLVPLSRFFVHKDLICSTDQVSVMLDITMWDRPVVGKVLVSEKLSKRTQAPSPSAFVVLKSGDLDTQWPYIITHHNGQQILHPVDTVVNAPRRVEAKPVVIVVMPFLAVGGAERVALDMIRYLQHEIDFVVVATDPFDSALGTTADAFRQVTPYVYVLPNFLAPPLRLSFFAYLFKAFHPSTLYIANGSIWIYDELLPYVKHHHPSIRTVNQVYDHHVGWINRYDRDLIALLDAHIGPNEKICQEYARRGVPTERIYPIEHGVDVHEYDPARYSSERIRMLRRELQLPEDKRIVTFIARLHPQKRPLDFVELARRFANDPSVFFLMVGDGPLAGTVDAEVQRIGLTNLERRPFYRPSRDIFAISDVIVLPSEYEGMPLVVLEAQAMGKPVVVTDVGNNREVITRTGGGVVVPRIGDIGALRAGVLAMLNSPPDPQKLRQVVVEHYSWEQIGPRYRRALLGEETPTNTREKMSEEFA